MVIFKGNKSECIKRMLALEATYGREFWVSSMDDAAGTYCLECSSVVSKYFESAER